MSNELLEKVLQLRPVERLELVEEIWASLNGAALSVSDEHQELLKERMAADDANPQASTSWAETKRLATEEFHKRRAAKRSA